MHVCARQVNAELLEDIPLQNRHYPGSFCGPAASADSHFSRFGTRAMRRVAPIALYTRIPHRTQCESNPTCPFRTPISQATARLRGVSPLNYTGGGPKQ